MQKIVVSVFLVCEPTECGMVFFTLCLPDACQIDQSVTAPIHVMYWVLNWTYLTSRTN